MMDERRKEDAVKKTKACVIYDASFGRALGHEVALSERADAGRSAQQALEKAGFRARLSSAGERSLRLWYLKTDAPFEKIWDILRNHFAGYLRFEITPSGHLRVSDSDGCMDGPASLN